MKRRTRAWTLVEALVVTSLLSLIVVVSCSALQDTARSAGLETQRNLAQTQGLMLAGRLQMELQRTASAGLKWQPAAVPLPAILAAHPSVQGPLDGRALWDNHWTCFLWYSQSKELYLRQFPETSQVPPPAVDHANALSADGLTRLLSDPPLGRKLCNSLTLLDYQLTPGSGTVRLQLELEVAKQGRVSQERFKIERIFSLRNHS